MIGRTDWAALARSIARVVTAQRSTVQLLAWLILGLWLVHQLMPAGPRAGAPVTAAATQGADHAHRRHAGGTLSRARPEGDAAPVSAPDAADPRQALGADAGAQLAGTEASQPPPGGMTAPAAMVTSGRSAVPAVPAQGAAAPFAPAPGAGAAASHGQPEQAPPPAASHQAVPVPGTPAPGITASPMVIDDAPGARMPEDVLAGGAERPLTEEELDAIMGVTHPDPAQPGP